MRCCAVLMKVFAVGVALLVIMPVPCAMASNVSHSRSVVHLADWPWPNCRPDDPCNWEMCHPFRNDKPPQFLCLCSYYKYGRNCEFIDRPPADSGYVAVPTGGGLYYWATYDRYLEQHVEVDVCSGDHPIRSYCKYYAIETGKPNQIGYISLEWWGPQTDNSARTPGEGDAFTGVYFRLNFLRQLGSSIGPNTVSITLSLCRDEFLPTKQPYHFLELGHWTPNNFTHWDLCNTADCYWPTEHTLNFRLAYELYQPRKFLFTFHNTDNRLLFQIYPVDNTNRFWLKAVRVDHPCENNGVPVRYPNDYYPTIKCRCHYNNFGTSCEHVDEPPVHAGLTTVPISLEGFTAMFFVRHVQQPSSDYHIYVPDFNSTDTAGCHGPAASRTHAFCDYFALRAGLPDTTVEIVFPTYIPASFPKQTRIASISVRLSLLQNTSSGYRGQPPVLALLLSTYDGRVIEDYEWVNELWSIANLPYWNDCNTLDCYEVREHEFTMNSKMYVTAEKLYATLVLVNYHSTALLWPHTPLVPNRLWINYVNVPM